MKRPVYCKISFTNFGECNIPMNGHTLYVCSNDMDIILLSLP